MPLFFAAKSRTRALLLLPGPCSARTTCGIPPLLSGRSTALLSAAKPLFFRSSCGFHRGTFASETFASKTSASIDDESPCKPERLPELTPTSRQRLSTVIWGRKKQLSSNALAHDCCEAIQSRLQPMGKENHSLRLPCRLRQ